ncbi:RTA-like protein [Purpureocillium lavendulum]|uniref:RTA-like protein n=1 Tax=Purpureocillium lavendulum TaxID=1247861 RepID=A0AB34FE82_9HYPO|nr:RTA-like protein [Purpureocillium lavendulum]
MPARKSVVVVVLAVGMAGLALADGGSQAGASSPAERSFECEPGTPDPEPKDPSQPAAAAQCNRPQRLPKPKGQGCITMGASNVPRHDGALGELQQNQQEPARSPRKARDDAAPKYSWGNISLKPTARSRDPSPEKPKKARSGANLVGLLTRPKSLKNLYKLATDDEVRAARDKENRTPDEPMSAAARLPPPIFAQFTSDATREQRVRSSVDMGSPRPIVKERPQSLHVPRVHTDPDTRQPYTEKPASHLHRSKVLGAFANLTGRSGSTESRSREPQVDTEELNRQLEALLDRRNIPENQRYKMRNLSTAIKLEFIHQDRAEMHAAGVERSGTLDSNASSDMPSATPAGSDDEEKPKRGRGRSFTFSRGKKERSSSKKSKGEGTLGRHFRSKSTDSVASERPVSSASYSSGSGFLAKVKLQQGPGDYVTYLRKVQKPELVEVGKLHKLRLLLRNETVSWIEDFIQQGGMREIVGLLNRIMEVEWREEHEDALLHENLLCLKALSTTARAMEHLHTVQDDLFPKLLHMLFDPDKKGPSEFTTRNIITSVLLTYIESAPPAERVPRAKSLLRHLRDPEPKESDRPLPFVLEMHRERPYRVWCKEVVSVTKEVFWIFLHNLNVVALPSDNKDRALFDGNSGDVDGGSDEQRGPHGYMLRHFPPERPPVPAAPYVGGVEWDATNYLASHLDLVNALLACTPTAAERNALRGELRVSGWERCMGGSLRLCKEKFYGSVHAALRTWVAAAAEDGWDVRDVRFGPPPEARGSPRKMAGGGGGGQKPKVEDAPKLDMPKLDLGLSARKEEAWL